MMIAKTLLVVLVCSLAILSYGQKRSAWKSASTKDGSIEFQWSRPAGNSCEVSFRDLQLRQKTSVVASIRYLPHRSAKNTVETDTAKIVIASSRSASEHISDCEEVVDVNVNGMGRE